MLRILGISVSVAILSVLDAWGWYALGNFVYSLSHPALLLVILGASIFHVVFLILAIEKLSS